MLLNNIAKMFNLWIKDARKKLVLTTLELIQLKLMNWFVAKQFGIEKATHTNFPRIRAKLERAKSDPRFCLCSWTNGTVFEVEPLNERQKLVNIGRMECSCNR